MEVAYQYIVPASLTFLVGILLWLLKRDRLSLKYHLLESHLFPSETGAGKYFVCTLQNSGNKALVDITFIVTIKNACFESVRFSNEDLISVSTKSVGTIEGTIKSLNPKETFGAVITVKEASDNSELSIASRCIGATAVEKKESSVHDYILQIAIAVVIGGIVSFFAGDYFGRKAVWSVQSQIKLLEAEVQSTREIIEKEHEELEAAPSSQSAIITALNKNSLGFVLGKMVNDGAELSFWGTGLYLYHVSGENKKITEQCRSAIVSMSQERFIAPESKALLLYLAGKMAQRSGDINKSNDFFVKAKQAHPGTAERMMENDMYFDVVSSKTSP